MPLSPEEPQIHESVPGRSGGRGTTRTPQASRPTPPLPGPRTTPRPAPPRADRNDRPGPGHPGAARGAGTAPARPPAPPQTGTTAKATAKATADATASATTTVAAATATAEIQLVAATDATALTAADETVDRLLDDGHAPGSVLVLTTGEPHPWTEHEMSFGEDAYWRQLADGDDVFCAPAASVARIDRRAVVVLAVNGGTDVQVSQALPEALKRAGDRLVVCGDPERLGALL